MPSHNPPHQQQPSSSSAVQSRRRRHRSNSTNAATTADEDGGNNNNTTTTNHNHNTNTMMQLAKPMTPAKVVPPPILSSHRVLVEDDNEPPDNNNNNSNNNSNNSLSRHNSFNQHKHQHPPTAQQKEAADHHHHHHHHHHSNSNNNNGNNNNGNNGKNTTKVDFIGPAKAVKNLFSLPYNNDVDVSVAIHNMGNGTILLDSGEDMNILCCDDATTGHDNNDGGVELGGGGIGVGSRSSSSTSSSGANNNNNGRRGRRRQRPRSWSIKEEQPSESQGQDNDNDGGSTKLVNDADELNQVRLAQMREGERSLLASLSLLLEEEKQQQRQLLHAEDGTASNNENNEAVGGDIIQSSSPNEEIARVASSTSSSSQVLEEEDKLISSANNALTVPTNAVLVGDELTSTPIVKTPFDVSATTRSSSQHATATTTRNSNNFTSGHNHNDPLADALHPPQHYLRHVVSPPSEPRQYVDWKFHDTKLLIASDAVIYKHNGGGAGGNDNVNNTKNGGDDGDGNGSSNNATEDQANGGTTDSIAIRVADTSDLKSQMQYHERMVKEGLPFSESTRGSYPALPPSSYAEALLKPSSSEDEDEDGCSEMEHNNNVKLQTCIIPAASGVGPEWAQLGFSQSPTPPPPVVVENPPMNATTVNGDPSGEVGGTTTEHPLPYSSAPVCTVLDAYLDNVMANVPQLALILREHGFVQNIKLLRTEDIPSLMMHPSTLGGGDNHAGHQTNSAVPPSVFSPEIVEMNAAMLLRFLKTNCTSENSTYLLHRAAGAPNIQLFDISSVAELRQRRKWTWWLALCSYRFACRLEQLQTGAMLDNATRREYRSRQRSLLHNTLNLLEELADMDGGRHDTIGAAVCEHLADTYLRAEDEADGENVGIRVDPSKPVPCASSSQPYGKVTVDCLNKAHDHLMSGIKKLAPLLEKARQDKSAIEIEAISTQLYGIHHKIVNVNLRLADRHYQSYYSSNLIQSIRMAARLLSDATSLLFEFNSKNKNPSDTTKNESDSDNSNQSNDVYAQSLLLQHAWLWEYCGHYARSFAADDLWRERGHTCGSDLIGLFREVDALVCGQGGMMKRCFGKGAVAAAAAAANNKGKSISVPMSVGVGITSHGQVSLNSLSGIVILPKDFEEIEASVLQKEGCHEAIGAAKKILDRKTQIKRDARLVLVAACVCYGHAIDSYVFLAHKAKEKEENSSAEIYVDGPRKAATPGLSSKNDKDSSLFSMTKPGGAITSDVVAPLLRQRLGDACNEIGKVLLKESREVLLPEFEKKSGISNDRFDMSHVSAIMLASAQFWFYEGLKQFVQGKDLRNLALLRCNLCQCCKIRANTNVILPGSSAKNAGKNNSESYLQEAVDHLVSAHNAMGERDADPVTWDMVSEELAATLLVLGVRRRQSALSSSSEPLIFQALRLTPGTEKSIVEPMKRSCNIYESLGTSHAAHQAAAAHYQLALYFSKVWTCQRDEGRTREKLAAAFEHYGYAHRFFSQNTRGNETTFAVLCLDFSNLYSAVSSEEECLCKALRCCLDSREAFYSLPPAAANQPAVLEQMTLLAESVDSRVSKLVLNLVKIEKENNSKLPKIKGSGKLKYSSEKYKNMYRKVLGHKMAASRNKDALNSDEEEDHYAFPIYELLKTLSEEAI